MHAILALVGFLTLLSVIPCAAQKPSKFTKTMPTASVSGRVTVHMTVGRTFGEHPVASLPLYLLRVEDSKAFQELQRKCRRAVARTQADAAAAAYETCTASLADAAKLVPELPATASGKTDREGNFRFENVPARGRYQVVGVKYEGDEPVVIVGLTPPLKAGGETQLRLSENDPWTAALPGKQ
jgi:hypothetical protein